MAFKKGKSGNPTGKPIGAKSRLTKLREGLTKDLPGLLDKVKSAALAGDMTAAKMLLDRTLPPVRAESAPVHIPELAEGKTLSEKAQAIINAVANGVLAPSIASELLSALGAVCKIIETDDLENRIAALEKNRT